MRAVSTTLGCLLPLAALGQDPPVIPLPLPERGVGQYVQITTRLPFESTARTLWVQKIDDEYVYQGDIVVAQDGVRPFFHGTDDSDERWPNGDIPIVIDQSVFAEPQVLEPLYDAMNALMWQTEIRLVPRTRQRDYVNITMGNMIPGAAARSWPGRRGGAQDLTIGHGFSGPAGTLLHEFLHAAGVYHEQSRPDRNMHVYFDLTGLSEEAKQNFDRRDGQSIGGYDYSSLMHYGPWAFNVGRQTIFCKIIRYPMPCPANMGQRDAMTQADIAGLDQLYSEISRFSEGGWNASITRDLPLGNTAEVQGSISWDSSIGMPDRPNWGSGSVDYVRMSVSAPHRETITWANRQKRRSLSGWRPFGGPVYQGLGGSPARPVLPYRLVAPADVPLRLNFEVVESEWGTFPPAGARCADLLTCGYGLSSTSSAAGALQLGAGGVAVVDYSISGEWYTAPRFKRPPQMMVEMELVKRILQKRDWVMRPIDPVHRLDQAPRIWNGPVRPEQGPVLRPER